MMTIDAHKAERGSALLIVLLLLSVTTALLGAFFLNLDTDQNLRAMDRSRTRVFYAAQGGLERLTADLGNLFMTDSAPTVAEIDRLTTTKPTLSRVAFDDPSGGTGYEIQYAKSGNVPATQNRTIMSGPFEGFTALATQYTLAVTARGTEAPGFGAEVRLERTMQTVSIPVFQFGVFSDTDLSFFSGPDFNFGGRVHTNGNLFLAVGNDSTLTMADRVTAAGEVVRTHLSNGWDLTNPSHTYLGNVSVLRAPASFRDLLRTEGSLVGTLSSSQREPGWTTTSITDYNGYLRNGRTGARRLDLPFVTMGALPIDLIRRGVVNENVNIAAQRFYKLASLRILLSDTAADLAGLPGVTATAPVPLTGTIHGTPLAVASHSGSVNIQIVEKINRPSPSSSPVTIKVNSVTFDATAPVVTTVVGSTTYTFSCSGKASTPVLQLTGCLASPVVPSGGISASAASPRAATVAPVSSAYRVPGGTSLVGGYIKIELQRADETWVDVTGEVLDLGFTGRNLAASTAATGCSQPAPDAIIRVQRLRNDPTGGEGTPAAGGARCGNNSSNGFDYWPNTLYDTREANLRDDVATGDTTLRPGGVIHYVELDVNNLRRWLAGAIGASGSTARSVNGFTVYFSDRRGNRNAANVETGEFGFEDFINPSTTAGTPDGVLQVGEDVNGNGVLDVYGQTPRLVTDGSGAYTNASVRPWTSGAVTAAEAVQNPPLFFRRALKVVNGTLGNLPAPGLTIVAENPIYVQGNYNASGGGFTEPNVAAAIMADALTLLSNGWNDNVSFASPNDPGGRDASSTWYRMAVLSGKGQSFNRPTAGDPPNDFGTDGGVHNFLRYLEDWGGQALNYRGSIASFFFSRQAVGTYKCCTNVYSPPTRGYSFDVEFLQPALLPPLTPMFRDINTTGFTQVVR